MAGEMPKSLLFVPMIAGGKVTGIISLQNLDREHAFTEANVRLLTTITANMGVALENARLFNETQRLLKETEQRAAELSVVNSVQRGLASKLDMQAIYDLVGDKIREVFSANTLFLATLDLKNGTMHRRYAYEEGKRYEVPPELEVVDGGTSGLDLLPSVDALATLLRHLIVEQGAQALNEPRRGATWISGSTT